MRLGFDGDREAASGLTPLLIAANAQHGSLPCPLHSHDPFISFALVYAHMERVGSCLAVPRNPFRMTYFGDNMAKDCTKAEAEIDT